MQPLQQNFSSLKALGQEILWTILKKKDEKLWCEKDVRAIVVVYDLLPGDDNRLKHSRALYLFDNINQQPGLLTKLHVKITY